MKDEKFGGVNGGGNRKVRRGRKTIDK